MDVKELVSKVDIVDYISNDVELEKRGEEWWGISPFTWPPEKTPSFSVRQNPPFFYDYSSGKSGNIITYIKERDRCSGREAVDKIMKFAGFDGKLDSYGKRLAATTIFRKYAPVKTQTKKQSSTILPQNYMERYERRLDKLQIWLDEGISQQSLDKFQVRYDCFSNRIVYPIRNMNGDIVNIGGRALDKDWKERGERKYTYFFSWGTIDTIYGVPENMNDIKNRHEVIIFEGCKSVLLADTWGIHNTGAILTSHLSSNQMKILAKLGCDVVFALDKEVRVRDDKNIQKLKRYVNVRYLWDRENLLQQKDAPVDEGEEVFKKLYDNQQYRL